MGATRIMLFYPVNPVTPVDPVYPAEDSLTTTELGGEHKTAAARRICHISVDMPIAQA